MTIRTRLVSLIASSSLAAGMAVAFAEPDSSHGHGSFRFEPLPTSAACTLGGVGVAPNEQPFLLPPGFVQTVIAREGDGGAPDNFDMNTLNETGRQAGRFLFRAHETPGNGAVSVTDRRTDLTRILVQRADWNRLDGIVWTPWRTLLVGEEMRPERQPSLPDPMVPQALAGLVYEVDPQTGATIARPALGAKAHEGIRFDRHGNVYGISETAPTTRVGTPPQSRPGGYIFKFTPDRRGDLSSGQLYALKIVNDSGDRTGEAIWVPLDRQLVQIDADAAATMVGATGYARPEDVETATSTGNDRNPSENLYVAVTDENRVLRIELGPRRHDDDDDDDRAEWDDEARGERGAAATAFVSDYVRQGVNAPADFTNPDNLALDKAGNLFITEDTPTPPGMDIWMATPASRHTWMAASTVRFASLTDCGAEPSGIYFDLTGTVLFANVLHRGEPAAPDKRDLAVMIRQQERRRN